MRDLGKELKFKVKAVMEAICLQTCEPPEG